jgi:mannosylglycerate hydrolase
MHVHIVSHTHWDREWYLTYEQFRLRLVGLIDRLLDMMEAQPEYEYFHLDGQTIVLDDYLELRPHQEPRLRKLIADGRILIGPWYDMPDEFLVSGESLVRNLALGHRIARRFGTPMPVGYLPDLFGHVGQMPQILRHFGLDNAILWRGFGGPRAEYWWQAPDGSRVLMMHLPPAGYCNATRVHLDPAQMLERATAAIHHEASRTAVGEVLLMNGVDHVEPHPVIPHLARQLSQAIGAPVRHSTLPAYVNAVRTAVQENGVGDALESIEGELRAGEDYANLLPGVFSARVYLKQANARVQTLLEKRAEPLATFAWMLGAPYPAHELRYAWKTLLQNHPHDSICGCSIDPVHEENMTRFARAEQVARAVVDQAADLIARAVPPAPPAAIRLVAMNTTAVPFSGTITAVVDVPYDTDEPRRVIDPGALDSPVVFWPRDAHPTAVVAPDGRSRPVQLLEEEESRPLVMSRYETPWVLRARRWTLAWPGDVPACGIAAFDLRLSHPASAPEATDRGRAGRASIDNPVTSTDDRTPRAPHHEQAAHHRSSTMEGTSMSADGLESPASHQSATSTEGSAPLRTTDRSAENALVRLSINDDGTVEVVDKRTGTIYARCGELEDVADVGDEYNYSPPPSDRRITSADAANVRVTRVHDGPVRASFRVEFDLPLPVAITPDRSARADDSVLTPVSILVSLDADSPRVAWHVSLDNRAKDHRLRLLFPTGVDSVTHVRAETAFGVARRLARREVPQDNRWEIPVSYGPTGGFTEAGGDSAGAIVFGEGLAEYEAVPDEHGHTSRIGLTLLRCVGYLSREDLVLRPSGHAGPGMATPGAQCPGHHAFRIAFEPRGGTPSHAALFQRAASFVAPPHVVAAAGPGGTLPVDASFLRIEAARGAVVLSACARSEDDETLLLRVFNPGDEPAVVRVIPRGSVLQAARVDLLGHPVEALTVADDAFDVSVGPHRIETLRVEMAGLTAR